MKSVYDKFLYVDRVYVKRVFIEVVYLFSYLVDFIEAVRASSEPFNCCSDE